ncbi:DUF7681 family protein [Methylobacterium nodulans]|uniref:Acb2/Tad1 hairpin domain-containing protein n=1 Tax=Methylobacterium nodulans (strain LMG 21967 / CNCM I-2342 / ORS 2060) TaxID=460265 RepID=B8ID95_METNO|nr:hypothetical protein [Methylobacterium nodulans]ACL61261.1 hypothetical protein Mnod_6490 [Methylobacterium nodulans ORS 2060]
MATVESTSDKRTANNGVRHQSRLLTEDEKALVTRIKDAGATFIQLIHEIAEVPPSVEKLDDRDLELTRTHVEDAVMRAVRAVTT